MRASGINVSSVTVNHNVFCWGMWSQQIVEWINFTKSKMDILICQPIQKLHLPHSRPNLNPDIGKDFWYLWLCCWMSERQDILVE